MRRLIITVGAFSLLVACTGAFVMAQTPDRSVSGEVCDGPAYKAGEVSQRATIISRPIPELTDEARANGVRGRVVLEAVLCRTGRVTDIRVVEGLPFGVTERAVEAARETTFTPAAVAGRPVSQSVKFDSNFDYVGDRRPPAEGPLEGRAIESVEVTGYAEGVSEQLDEQVRLLSGQTYSKELVEQARQRLLQLGNFDPQTSHVRVEEGVMGGLGVVFQMQKRAKE